MDSVPPDWHQYELPFGSFRIPKQKAEIFSKLFCKFRVCSESEAFVFVLMFRTSSLQRELLHFSPGNFPASQKFKFSAAS